MKQFDDTLWMHQDKTSSVKKWICEEVENWVIAIYGMSDSIGTTFLANKVNVVSVIFIRQEDFK